YVIAPAQCGECRPGNRSFGHSLIVDPWGEILADAGPDRVGIIYGSIDPARIKEVRERIRSLSHDRPYRPALGLCGRRILRATLILWHRRFALGFAAFLLLQILTGISLVFREELTAIDLPGPRGPAELSLAALKDSVHAAYPSSQLLAAQFPSAATRDYLLKVLDASGRLVMVVVDPADPHPRPVGELGAVLEWIRGFHEDLSFGLPGRSVICLYGVGLLFMVVSGLTLWWPGVAGLPRSMRLPLRGPARTVLYWWHRTAGSIVSLLVVPTAITGFIL